MKFGKKLKELRIAKWADYYIDYQELKYILKSHLENAEHSDEEATENKESSIKIRFGGSEAKLSIVSSKKSGMKKNGKDQPHRDLPSMSVAFFTMLEDEVNLVEAFYLKMVESLRIQLDKASLLYHNSDDFNSLQYAKTKAMSALAHHISHDINMLVSFVEVNKLAVRKIVKKYSKRTKQPVLDKVTAAVEKGRTFMNAESLYKLRDDAEKFFTKVSKRAYRNAFTAVV
mmetsp:Transcript_12736/g.15103  ORF Transcript_12736/g.15103 Transcript_12736/m.15103 type:complete len:229 (+) Transcript_12736:104-790(+)